MKLCQDGVGWNRAHYFSLYEVMYDHYSQVGWNSTKL